MLANYPGERSRHSTGLTVKAQAERFVIGILKGDISQHRSQRLTHTTEHLFISENPKSINGLSKASVIHSGNGSKCKEGILTNHILPEIQGPRKSLVSLLLKMGRTGFSIWMKPMRQRITSWTLSVSYWMKLGRAGLVKENFARQIETIR